MITITKEFTKEQLQQIIETDHVQCGEASALARIALASLEAEAVAFVMADDLKDSSIISTPAYRDLGEAMERTVGDVVALYAAPPAPVSLEAGGKLSHFVASQESLGGDFEKVLAKNIEELYVPGSSAQPAPVSAPDEREAFNIWNNDTDCPLAGRDAKTAAWLAWCRRSAMLQGVEPVTTGYKLPANTPCKDAPEHIWLQTAGVWPENGEFSELTWCRDNQHPDDTLYVRADVVTGNSPVIPDGWVMVPIEPTEDMIVNGFESEPDESFSDADVWEAYDAMSGCQQAAHRAKLCWSAMISAAPKPDVR